MYNISQSPSVVQISFYFRPNNSLWKIVALAGGGVSPLGYGVSKDHLYVKYRRSLVLVANYLLFHRLYTLVKISKTNHSNCSKTL